jgi:hypothetical protein
MALSPMYFQILSPDQANPLGYGMQQGTQTANNIMQARGKSLQNQQLQAQLPYAGQMAQAQLATAQQQAPYMQSQTDLNQASLPYMGYKFMAPMMMAQARMAQAGIQNSNAFRNYAETPQGAALLQADPNMANTFQNAMQNSAGMINGGGMPQQMPPTGAYNNPASYPQLPGAQTGQAGTPINPQQINQLRQLAQPGVPDATTAIQNASSLLAQKKMTDASARQKNLYASNIEKTLNQIDPDALTQYAGGTGTLEKYMQSGLSSVGQESANFDNYQKSLNAANMLATQTRQFYGDSIQPSMIQRLEGLTNPSTWSTNPKLAKELFNQTKNILQQETGTYRQAMQSTAPYQAQSFPQQPANNQVAPTASKMLGGTTYHKINGQWYAQ